jgi:hypothetical protein
MERKTAEVGIFIAIYVILVLRVEREQWLP